MKCYECPYYIKDSEFKGLCGIDNASDPLVDTYHDCHHNYKMCNDCVWLEMTSFEWICGQSLYNDEETNLPSKVVSDCSSFQLRTCKNCKYYGKRICSDYWKGESACHGWVRKEFTSFD